MMMGLPAGWRKAPHESSKSGEKTFCCFNEGGLTSHLPPPPQLRNDEDSDNSSTEDANNESGDARVHFPQPPPDPNKKGADAFDPCASVVRASMLTEKAVTMTGSETATAIKSTLDPDNVLKRDLLPKCAKAPGTSDVHPRASLAEIKLSVRKFFHELHESEGANLREPSCCEKPKQQKGRGSSLQHN